MNKTTDQQAPEQGNILTRIYAMTAASSEFEKSVGVSAILTANVSTDGYKRVSPSFPPLAPKL